MVEPRIRFKVITVLPQLIEDGMNHGVIGSACKKGFIQLETITPRLFASDNHKTIDDRPFGGGDGMVMLPETLNATLDHLQQKSSGISAEKRVCVYLSPQGTPWTSQMAADFAARYSEVILICGRYAGVDQRLLNQRVDLEVSIGDYVVSGGELPALIIMDSIGRYVPGVLGHAQSAQEDSFHHGLLEAPLFTRPRDWNGQSVPDVLVGGDHRVIAEWREACSWWITLQKRPDLFLKAWRERTFADQKLVLKKMREFLQNLTPEVKEVINLKLDLESIFPYEQELSASSGGPGPLSRK